MGTSSAIRTARTEDLSQVVRLWDAVGMPTDSYNVARLVDALMPERPLALFVAEVDGGVVGAVVAGWDGWWGWLYRLAVAPGRRNRGLGEVLVRRAETYLASRGARYVNTIVRRDNTSSLTVFEKAGFKMDDTHVRVTKTLAPAESGVEAP